MNELAPVPAQPDNSLINVIARAASDPDIDVTKLERLITLQREVLHEGAKREFAQALAAAQGEMEAIARDSVNPHTRSRYAKLEAIDAVMRPIYTKHGFSVRYGSAPASQPSWVRITCTVAHRGGYYEDHYLESPLDMLGTKGKENKTAVQAVGSTVSYLRRYLLQMVFNVVLYDKSLEDGAGDGGSGSSSDDDDGEATRPDPLDETNGTLWLRNFHAALQAATTLEDLHRINQHPSTVKALAKAPTIVKQQITDALNKTYERLAGKLDKQAANKRPTDLLQAALFDVERLTLPELEEINNNVYWTGRLGELFPPDADQVHQKIEARKQELKHAGA